MFDKLEEDGASYFYNLGTGTPNSVREIISAVEEVTGLTVPVVEAERRAGDPPALYADSSKAQAELGWTIQYSDVKDTIATAWKWHQANPNGFES